MHVQEGRPGFLEGRVTPHYVGFWRRVVAGLVDLVLLLLVCVPLLYLAHGPAYFGPGLEEPYHLEAFDIFVEFGVPFILTIAFWYWWGATPGKMAIGARIVDVASRTRPSLGQLVIRYVGYFPATFILGVGILWVGWDRRKQGWHDKMASTVVVERGK